MAPESIQIDPNSVLSRSGGHGGRSQASEIGPTGCPENHRSAPIGITYRYRPYRVQVPGAGRGVRTDCSLALRALLVSRGPLGPRPRRAILGGCDSHRAPPPRPSGWLRGGRVKMRHVFLRSGQRSGPGGDFFAPTLSFPLAPGPHPARPNCTRMEAFWPQLSYPKIL